MTEIGGSSNNSLFQITYVYDNVVVVSDHIELYTFIPLEDKKKIEL